MSRNGFTFLDRSDPEFQFAFSHFADPVMRNETYREYLQYMGTVQIEGTGKLEHQFRHRAVPGTNERKYWRIPVSPTFAQRVERGEVRFS